MGGYEYEAVLLQIQRLLKKHIGYLFMALKTLPFKGIIIPPVPQICTTCSSYMLASPDV